VIDLNSLNGVFVNETRLEEATLAHGDHVRIGSLTFLVDLGAAAEPHASVLRSIADVLPGPGHEKRKAS
jgi:pSer/pThr/pTyr-binding forkhead associated (FHA) protein